MMTRCILAAAWLITFAACAVPSAEQASGSPLRVTRRGDMLELDNRSGRTIFYQVMERDMTTRARWVPCADPRRCEHLGVNAAAQIPLDAVPGYSVRAEALLVFWWFAARGPTGAPAPDTVRSAVVKL